MFVYLYSQIGGILLNFARRIGWKTDYTDKTYHQENKKYLIMGTQLGCFFACWGQDWGLDELGWSLVEAELR